MKDAGIRLIRLRYRDIIDMVVPETFVFKCEIKTTEEHDINDGRGTFIYDSLIDLSARDITLRRKFPTIKANTFFNVGGFLIPITEIFCEYI
ncbi:MAG: hypothetical protein J6I32_03235 [Bacteroidaceae bacterium]|nr:hypothetical protein [Bacteroidaceae bacterium]